MGLDPTPVGPAVGNDQPRGHRARCPAPAVADNGRQSSLSIERPDQLVDVGELRLQLDDEQGAASLMPRQDVDDASLAVDREGHLWRKDPAGQRAWNRRATCSWSAECRRFISRSRSPARHRAARSTRISRTAATALIVSIDWRPRCPRSSLETTDWDTPASRATSTCRRPRRCRTSRIAEPNRRSSMIGSWRSRIDRRLSRAQPSVPGPRRPLRAQARGAAAPAPGPGPWRPRSRPAARRPTTLPGRHTTTLGHALRHDRGDPARSLSVEPRSTRAVRPRLSAE